MMFEIPQGLQKNRKNSVKPATTVSHTLRLCEFLIQNSITVPVIYDSLYIFLTLDPDQ